VFSSIASARREHELVVVFNWPICEPSSIDHVVPGVSSGCTGRLQSAGPTLAGSDKQQHRLPDTLSTREETTDFHLWDNDHTRDDQRPDGFGRASFSTDIPDVDVELTWQRCLTFGVVSIKQVFSSITRLAMLSAAMLCVVELSILRMV